MNGPTVWQVLGIEETDDQTAIRRAYARALKAIDPETDPGAFRVLREARDRAMWAATTGTPVESGGEAEMLDGLPPTATSSASISPPPVEADLTALDELHAMVLDPASTASFGEIEEQTRRVLNDPAMINLDHATAVENVLANLITRGTPRSDPVIEPAIAHFRWNAPEVELTRPPILQWILQRAEDRYFEIGLPGDSWFYNRLLGELRAGPPRRLGWLAAWRRGPRVEFFLEFLHTFHPTVLASISQEAHDWWSRAIDRQKRLPFPLGWWHERRRRAAWTGGLGTHAGGARMFGWASGSPKAKLAAWLALLILASLARMCAAVLDDRGTNDLPIPGPTFAASAPIQLTTAEADIAAFLSRRFDGMDAIRARRANPVFYAALEEAWREAKAHPEDDGFSRFQVNAARVMDRTLAAALGGRDEALILDHARAYESRLRWAELAGADVCVDTLKGVARDVPADFEGYHAKLVARAILSGAAPLPAGSRKPRTFAVPPAIFADALKRSRLSKDAFRKASLGHGPSLAHCNAAIALIDAATVAPKAGGLEVLQGLFGR